MTRYYFAKRSVAMFLVLLTFHIALVAANPFHKYPYVFLLDVGNEEIKKTNTEQIRLSVPGGSIALRYPAVGTGDTIAHVRVSGIDFGTDLKANIVDGGPGYKYVVLVFMGNQGAPYDAVMTIQTVSDEDIDGNRNEGQSNSYNYYKNALVDNNSAEIVSNNRIDDDANLEDENVSAEETNEEPYSPKTSSTNTQLTQQSSNVYSYANNAAVYEDDEDDTSNENNSNTDAEISQRKPGIYSYVNRASDYEDDSDTSNDKENQISDSAFEQQVKSKVDDRKEANNEPEPSHFNDDYGNEDSSNDDNENESFQGDDGGAFEKLQPVMPLRVYDGVRVYPQYAVPFALPNGNSEYSADVAVDSDHSTNNDDDANKYKDSNNNYFDSDDASAIAS